ncbi:MAG TPA: GMP synthase (glutamine-hydrolyzing), partial [Lachnospiraceae bacterium]|nr:GMP synthase (glutamine-hydrolyzing) [Lachnospiraceae bacterium]
MNELVVVIDFGGQYNQLVARRVRENNVYCEIYSYRTPLHEILARHPMGIILTGGPSSVYEENAATCTAELFEAGIPVLGLCYGAQLMSYVLGGEVRRAADREYGKTETIFDTTSPLFEGIPDKSIVWMSHFDYISKLAPGFESIAHTASTPVAAAQNRERKLYAIQFHPEVLHTEYGKEILFNFVRNICGCRGDWKMDSFVESQIR